MNTLKRFSPASQQFYLRTENNSMRQREAEMLKDGGKKEQNKRKTRVKMRSALAALLLTTELSFEARELGT